MNVRRKLKRRQAASQARLQKSIEKWIFAYNDPKNCAAAAHRVSVAIEQLCCAITRFAADVAVMAQQDSRAAA